MIPGALAQRCSIGCYIDIQHNRLAIPHASQTSLQGGGQIARGFHLFALQAVSFRDGCVFDVRVTQIAIKILAGLLEDAAVEHVAGPTFVIGMVIHNHDEHWRLITRDAPQSL